MKVLIAAAGGAAHLPGVVAAWSLLPVIGVPMAGGALGGLDALLSMAQMPAGIPVATVAIGEARAAHARPRAGSHPGPPRPAPPARDPGPRRHGPRPRPPTTLTGA